MLKSIIVDKNEHSRKSLENLLTDKCSQVRLAGLYESVNLAMTAIEKFHPDLVFLDMELQHNQDPDLFESALSRQCGIIATAAHEGYALKAIKLNALDYLLKPFDAGDLIAAVNKAGQVKKVKPVPQGVNDLALSYYMPKSRSAKIAVPTFEGLQMLNTEDIVKCVAHESYTEIILTCGSRLMVSRILKEYEDMLSELNFFRIHNSCLINLRHVKKYIKGDGGYVMMTDGQSCEVSRRKKTELLNRLSLVEL